MAKVQHTCTGCVPIDASIVEAYAALLKANQDSSAATQRANEAAERAEKVGTFYGFFPSAAELPSTAQDTGYAMVGETSPFEVWTFDGALWSDSGTTMNSVPGESAYEIAVDNGYVGTEEEWLASLVGPQGPQGIQGIQGVQGIQGIQGNTGSSIDYPFELVNNLTTNDATKGLSAAQGKVLADDLSGALFVGQTIESNVSISAS